MYDSKTRQFDRAANEPSLGRPTTRDQFGPSSFPLKNEFFSAANTNFGFILRQTTTRVQSLALVSRSPLYWWPHWVIVFFRTHPLLNTIECDFSPSNITPRSPYSRFNPFLFFNFPYQRFTTPTPARALFSLNFLRLNFSKSVTFRADGRPKSKGDNIVWTHDGNNMPSTVPKWGTKGVRVGKIFARRGKKIYGLCAHVLYNCHKKKTVMRPRCILFVRFICCFSNSHLYTRNLYTLV